MARSDEEQLIQSLSADLAPVRRLPPPAYRALVWLAAVCVIAVGLAAGTDVAATVRRITAAPDLSLAVAGSALTAVLAAIAAFQLAVPDRRWTWALLPLPAAALWIGASGAGCLRSWLVPDTSVPSPGETEACLIFIFGLSVPLSILLLAMLRRGFSLQPKLAAAVAGLAAAAAAATLLNFVHPFDAAATDLAVHAIAVGGVILANELFGGRILAAKNSAKNSSSAT